MFTLRKHRSSFFLNFFFSLVSNAANISWLTKRLLIVRLNKCLNVKNDAIAVNVINIMFLKLVEVLLERAGRVLKQLGPVQRKSPVWIFTFRACRIFEEGEVSVYMCV